MIRSCFPHVNKLITFIYYYDIDVFGEISPLYLEIRRQLFNKRDDFPYLIVDLSFIRYDLPFRSTSLIWWGSCYSIFSFMCIFQIILCPFVGFFLPLCCLSFFDIRILITSLCLAIVLPVLLRYTDSDYPFGIFKLFLICGLIKIVHSNSISHLFFLVCT